jgi:hypothetical protein
VSLYRLASSPEAEGDPRGTPVNCGAMDGPQSRPTGTSQALKRLDICRLRHTFGTELILTGDDPMPACLATEAMGALPS